MTNDKETSDEVRETILFGAATVFDLYGYDQPLSTVARHTGLDEATVLNYFASKEELVSALIAKVHTRGRGRAEKIMKDHQRAVEALINVTTDFGRQLIGDVYIRVGEQLHTHVLVSQPVKQAWADYEKLISDLLAKGIRQGDIEQDIDATVLSHFISSAYFGVQSRSLFTTRYKDLMDDLFEMWTIILKSSATQERRGELFGIADRVILGGNEKYASEGLVNKIWKTNPQ